METEQGGSLRLQIIIIRARFCGRCSPRRALWMILEEASRDRAPSWPQLAGQVLPIHSFRSFPHAHHLSLSGSSQVWDLGFGFGINEPQAFEVPLLPVRTAGMSLIQTPRPLDVIALAVANHSPWAKAGCSSYFSK